MNQFWKFIIRCRIFLRRHFCKRKRVSPTERFVCKDDADSKTTECSEFSVCEILAPNSSVIRTEYGGNARQRKVKVKSLTEVLVLYARLCNKSQIEISHKLGRVICESKDMESGLSIDLCIRKRKLPLNTVAIMSINSHRAGIPVDKIFFCLKSSKMQ